MTRRPLIVLTILLCAGAAGAQAPAPARPAAADFVAPGPIVPLDAPVMAGIARLRAGAIAAHIALLASPAFEGRGLGGQGLEAAAEYAAAQLALAGVGPLDPAPGSPNPAAAYFHPVAVRQVSRATCGVRVESRRGDTTLVRTFGGGVDVLCPELPPGAISAPVVFAGYGIRESSPARDDYRGLDVKGKIVVLRAGLPPGADWQRPDLGERYAADSGRRRFAAKAQLAAAGGAVGVLAIEGPGFASTLSSGAEAPAAVFFTPAEPDDEAAIPVVRLSAAAGDAVLAAAGAAGPAGAPAQPGLPAGATATLTFGGEERLVLSRNVLGMIRGSDPARRDEAIVIGAHMDHL
ncbi:MAG: PA domain-containing protein, partial [Rhodospirillaceae bacterium]